MMLRLLDQRTDAKCEVQTVTSGRELRRAHRCLLSAVIWRLPTWHGHPWQGAWRCQLISRKIAATYS